MKYGICNLGLVPMRLEPSDKSEMTTQIQFGEHMKVLESRKKWSKVRLAFDQYEGWIDNKQFIYIEELQYRELDTTPPSLSGDLVNYIVDYKKNLTPITLGANLPKFAAKQLQINDDIFNFEGLVIEGLKPKSNIIPTAFDYLNTPYLWGGKTPFGIDCSGFTQMVYKLNGYKLKRDASQQATQGEALSFIEESEPGDLAFFDNEEGEIIHVGIIMQNHYIIHAHGKVRIDRIDHTGIFNVDSGRHSHKLRVIKKII